jgi:hypothetical protein
MSDVFPSVLYALYDLRYRKIADQNTKDTAQDVALDVHKSNSDAHPVQNVMEPVTHNTGRVGGSAKNYAVGYFNNLVLGGISVRPADLSAAPLNGMLMSGTSTFGGVDGVTITHNIGLINYVITVTPLAKAERVGGVWYVRAANTVTVYNTGEAGIQFSLTLSVDAGMNTPEQWMWQHFGELIVTGKLTAQNLLKTLDIQPDSDAARTLGSGILRYLQGHFVNLTLGGVSRNAWPTEVAGSQGNVFMSGAVTLAGQDGVTVSHYRGATDYLVKIMPTGTDCLGRIGEISYVKSANSVVIYNSGQGGFHAEIEISSM